MYRTVFWILWEKVRVGWSERIALKHVYYHTWNRSPVQVWCMRQMLRAGALGWSRGMGWGGRWEKGSGWGTHVNPWLIHIKVWQKPLQYCKVISLQLKKKKKKESTCNAGDPSSILGSGRSPGKEKSYQRVRHDWETFNFQCTFNIPLPLLPVVVF